MDLWVHRHLGNSFDAGGAWAAGGQVIPALLQAMLAEPYFSLPPTAQHRPRPVQRRLG